jgi:hypothetical protein
MLSVVWIQPKILIAKNEIPRTHEICPPKSEKGTTNVPLPAWLVELFELSAEAFRRGRS